MPSHLTLPNPWPRLPRGDRCSASVPSPPRDPRVWRVDPSACIYHCGEPAGERVLSAPFGPDGRMAESSVCARHRDDLAADARIIRNPRKR